MRAKGRYIKNGRFENDFFQKSGFFERNKIIFGIISFMGAAIPPYQARRALRSVFAKRSEPVFGMIEGNVSTSPFFCWYSAYFYDKILRYEELFR